MTKAPDAAPPSASGVGPRAFVITAAKAGESSRRVTEDAAALGQYLLGRVAMRKLWSSYQREAVAHFDAALARCPNDPTVLAACSIAYVRLNTLSGDDRLDRARLLAERALALEPNCADAQLALAALERQLGNDVRAIAPFVRALEIAPWLPDAHARWGELLLDIGEVQEGLLSLERAHALDPMLESALWSMAQAHALLGHTDRCDALFGARSATDENLSAYTWRRLRTVLYAPTQPRIARLRSDLGPLDFPLRFIVDAALRLVEGNELLSVFESAFTPLLRANPARARVAMFTTVFVDVLAFAARHDDALRELGRADEYHLIDRTWLERTPLLDDAFRRSPRYIAIHDRVRARCDLVRREATRLGVL
jgi:tetratricopeptide (TPR) repeat protein